MFKVYHGTEGNRKLIATCETEKEAFSEIDKHVKNVIRTNPPYYRFRHVTGGLKIDYGSHRNFYYMVFEN